MKRFLVFLLALVFLLGSASLAYPLKLVVVGDAGHNLRPFDWYAEDFKEKFDVELKVIGVPFGELYEKEKMELIAATGAYDIMIVYPKFLAEFAANGWLYPLDEFAQKLDAKLDDVTPGYRDFYCKYGGKLYALPYDGDVLNLYYRKDLLENEEERAAFKAKYGYDLKVPETWDEFLDVAEFFTRKAGEKLAGQVLERDFYGTAYYGQKDQIFAWWGNIFASLGGVYFDEETMEPAINSEAGIKALEIFKQIHQYCPPDVLSYGYEELKDVFLEGDCFMVIQWPCVGKKGADPNQSKIVGKIGVAHVPGVKKDGEVYYRALMPCGRVLAVAAEAKDPWKAYQVIHYLSVVTSMDDVSTAETGLDPYRYSHFAHPEEYEMFANVEDARIYLEGVQKNMEKGYPEMVLPGTVEYEETLGVELTRALAGEKTPEQALNDAAAAWRDILNRFGKEQQKKLYQELVAGWRAAGLW
ncbi:MAG: sugar ABC transporter substrate-binding protein [Candidatus Atribacteria bacterium]|nr:sugar ABC transporter substrate-binding protein [Candidatus Atribacteria bacterium]MCD6350186.1 sugar ABC transporter substrate-binding protein [Candidatus Atribacteria bacterium]